MTAKKQPRGKNQLGLLAGMDKDIESSKHDDIMVWLDQNLAAILCGLFPHVYGDAWATDSVYLNTYEKEDLNSVYYLFPQPLISTELIPVLPPKPPAKITQKKWEYPISSSSGGMAGFADMYIEVEYPLVTYNPNNDQYSVNERSTRKLVFEVKTSISLGALLRQINYYKTFLQTATFIVVSPDNRHVSILKEQQVLFVEYPIIPT